MRRGRVLILLGLILALVTAGGVFYILTQSAGQATTVEVEREEVVVAIQPIPEDEPVEGRVELRPMPVEAIPEGAIHSLESTSGLLAAGPIPQGTIIQPELLISPVELSLEGELGKLIEPGYEAVAFPITELSSVSYGIRPGDHVDILMTFFFVDMDQETQTKEPICPPLCPNLESREADITEQRPRLSSQLTLQDVEVLGVGQWITEPAIPEEGGEPDSNQEEGQVEPPSYITVMLTPQDALVLKLAREQGASIDLAVRAEEDHQQFATQEVTLDYILARFSITVPGKQPYSIENARELNLVSPP
jgi:pilus assembly protein CpaB